VTGRPAGLFYQRESSTPAMVLKPPRERIAELIGSLLGSAFAAAVMSAVMVLLQGFLADVDIRPEHFAWLLLVGMAGSWAVLIPSKLWEGIRGEPMLRRFVMMVLGMGIGLVAFGVSDLLMVRLPVGSVYPHSGYRLPSSFFALDGRPLMLAYVACFGTLFLLMRWWLQADPLRSTRLSLLTLLLSVCVAGLIALAWQFPQPWLPMAAATISVSVQLASPWRYPRKRKRQGY
jgi:eukaryotic-like serine/threonine-protein kinase